MENQLYQKIFDNISKVASQLEGTAAQMRRTVKIFAGVVNWFDQSIYLNQDDYQGVVNKLEPNEEQERASMASGWLRGRETTTSFSTNGARASTSQLIRSCVKIILTGAYRNLLAVYGRFCQE